MSKSDEQVEREDKKRIARQAVKAFPPTTPKGGNVADWQNADPNLVLRLVCVMGTNGGAVRFGYTRDGGAYSIGIYLGENSKTYYCNEAEGINEKLRELADYFNE